MAPAQRARSLAASVGAHALPALRAVAAAARTRAVPAVIATVREARSEFGPTVTSLVGDVRGGLAPAMRRLGGRGGAAAGGLGRRLGPAIRRGLGGAGSAAGGAWARLDRRGRAAVAGSGGLLAVALVLVLAFGRGGNLVPLPGESPGPTASPAPTQISDADLEALLARVLPTPSTTDTVLLVADPSNPSAAEAQWLTDLRGRLGNVDALAYREASLDRLRSYFVVFVIDQNPDLDPGALADAYASGLTIHLIGPAAQYQARVAGTTP